MAFPEWGNSYNALHVPLTSDWQCALVPARDVQDVDRGWTLSYEGRQKLRRERETQIEQDQRDFDRLFRVSTSRRAARACSDFDAYTAFIREHLRISGLSAPVDGEGVTRMLRDAVRDGSLVPAIDRAWRGSRRVGRPYAPQSWPKRAPDPKPTIYGVRNGEFIALDEAGRFVDKTPYVTVAGRAGRTGIDWLGSVESIGGVALGDGSVRNGDVDGSEDDMFHADQSGDSTPLGGAQAFDFQPDDASGGLTELAARGVSEGQEAECFADYETDMELCSAGAAMYNSPAYYLACKERAFQRYQQCRGYR